MKLIGRGQGPIESKYHTHNILTVPKQIDLELCKLWHKKTLGLTPPKLTENMMTDHRSLSLEKTHQYQTRQKNLLNRPTSTHREYHDSFLVKGNRIYSQLNWKIRSEDKIGKFVKALKRHL